MAHPLGDLSEFISDGCSGGMSWCWTKLFGHAPPWEGCCVEHDKCYHVGGSEEDRKAADTTLRACVEKKGHSVWGFLMYYAVRLGGGPRFPSKYRWGYGYKYSFRGGYKRFMRKRSA